MKTKSFPCHTSEFCAVKSNHCHTSKKRDCKSIICHTFSNFHFQSCSGMMPATTRETSTHFPHLTVESKSRYTIDIKKTLSGRNSNHD